MARFEDTPDLFGSGMGWSTAGEFTCCICGITFNEGADETEDYDNDIGIINFAGNNVCEGCFEHVEQEILNRMDDIIPWYKRYIEAHRKRVDKEQALIDSLSDVDV